MVTGYGDDYENLPRNNIEQTANGKLMTTTLKANIEYTTYIAPGTSGAQLLILIILPFRSV